MKIYNIRAYPVVGGGERSVPPDIFSKVKKMKISLYFYLVFHLVIVFVRIIHCVKLSWNLFRICNIMIGKLYSYNSIVEFSKIEMPILVRCPHPAYISRIWHPAAPPSPPHPLPELFIFIFYAIIYTLLVLSVSDYRNGFIYD